MKEVYAVRDTSGVAGFIILDMRGTLAGYINILCVRSDRRAPGIGTAVSREQIVEDIRIMREMGATGLRLAHVQHAQAAYEEADRLGLGRWTEIGIAVIIIPSKLSPRLKIFPLMTMN